MGVGKCPSELSCPTACALELLHLLPSAQALGGSRMLTMWGFWGPSSVAGWPQALSQRLPPYQSLSQCPTGCEHFLVCPVAPSLPFSPRPRRSAVGQPWQARLHFTDRQSEARGGNQAPPEAGSSACRKGWTQVSPMLWNPGTLFSLASPLPPCSPCGICAPGGLASGRKWPSVFTKLKTDTKERG